MIKSIYAQSGKPGVSRLQFANLWREHGTHAMQCPDYFGYVDRYVQSDVLAAPTREWGTPRDYFGVGELCFSDQDRRHRANASRSRSEVIVPHGQALFGSAHPIALGCEEQVVRQHHEGAFKLYMFLAKPEGLGQAGFLQQWRAAAPSRLSGPQAHLVTSYIRSEVIDEAAAFGGVDELCFDRAADACAYLQGMGGHIGAAWSPFTDLSASVTLITEQIVMFRRGNYAD
ncbi:MAG: EthD domain-containing protein [Ottowia sp.]|uniref:EthD domain-containing protein n=1 Tax=Ottowia sp. TaxID=1898956 RepID=UPI003C72D276